MYVNVINSFSLIDFVKSVKQKLQLPSSRNYFSFHPHITIARSLTQEIATKAKIDYEKREYKDSFTVQDIVLLKRKNQYDRCLVIKEFEFYDTRFLYVRQA